MALTLMAILPRLVLAVEAEPRVVWSCENSEYYRLFYSAEHERDAKKVRRILDDDVAALKNEFACFPVESLLKVRCDIYLHPTANDKASESNVSINSGVDEAGSYFATIDLLTPSAYSPDYRSNIGEPVGDDYIQKLVMHEYSTILLDRITRAKKTGWRFFSAPGWFTNGYEEYLGLMLTSERNRNDVLRKYFSIHGEDRNRISFDFGIAVDDDYIEGALLLLFLHEEFGKERVQAILKSEERRFGSALATALGVRLHEIEGRWSAWLRIKLTEKGTVVSQPRKTPDSR